MSKREKILDDITRVAGDAVGLLSETGQQVGETLRTHVDDLAMRMDLVPREDFERLEAMLIKSREEQEDLKNRIEVLEKEHAKKDK